MTPEEALARARKGAALLDRHRPGWRDRISRGNLNIGSCYDCILGQEFGSYAPGLHALELYAVEDRAAHGFSPAEPGEGFDKPAIDRMVARAKALTAAWLRVLDEVPA